MRQERDVSKCFEGIVLAEFDCGREMHACPMLRRVLTTDNL